MIRFYRFYRILAQRLQGARGGAHGGLEQGERGAARGGPQVGRRGRVEEEEDRGGEEEEEGEEEAAQEEEAAHVVWTPIGEDSSFFL